MMVLDYLIANEDRHFNNFGVLRNAETLEWLGMAPVYDSGSSLGYDKLPAQMRAEAGVERRMEEVKGLMGSHVPMEQDRTENDVKENIAQAYRF